MWRRLLDKCFPRVSCTGMSRPRRNRWLAERLEPRLLLSADLLPTDDILHIVGTEADDSAVIRTLESDTGGASQLLVVLNGQSFEYTIETGQKIHIDLLGGNDKLDAQITFDADWDIVLGDGDDDTRLEALIGDRSADAHYRIDAGEGDNETTIQFGDGQQGRLPPTDQTDITAEYRSGAGNDHVAFEGLVHLDRSLDIAVAAATGAGNDNIVGQWEHHYDFRSGKFAQTDYEFELGFGDDALTWNFLGDLGDLTVRADAGEGNDTVQSHVSATWLTTGFFNIDAGDGDDVIDMCADIRIEPQPLPFVLSSSLTADAGEGNDRVHVDWFDNVPTSDFDVSVRVGQAASFRPERGDEVVIAFEHGDIEAPVFIGTLWAGADKPPQTQDETPVRDFRLEVDRAERVPQAVKIMIRSWDQKDNLDLDFVGTLADLNVQATLGGGDDTARLHIDTTGASRVSTAEIGVNAGRGDDLVEMTVRSDARATVETTIGLDLDLGAGTDTVRVDTSAFDEPAIGFFSEVSGLTEEFPVVDYQAGVDVGEDLTLQIDLADLESLFIKTGDRDDEIRVNLDHPQKLVPELAFCTGGGNDTIEASFVGVLGEVVFNLDTGDGDDDVSVNVTESNTIVTGAGQGGGPHVKAFSGATATETQSFFAYAPSFTGGVRVATGDINGDGVADIITGAGAGAGPLVKVFDGRSNKESSFFAYDPAFTGGVFVAAGDVNGDGRDDIITGTDSGAGPHVKVFDGLTGAEICSFFAYDPAFTGGVRVAAGDVNGDGCDDIITGAGPGAGPHVKVFDGLSGAEVRSFFAYDPAFTGGVFVAAGDVDGDNVADIVTGTDAGGAPHVKAFDGTTLAVLHSFFAYAPSFTGGVRVAAGDVNGDGHADIVTGTGPGAGPLVKAFDGLSGAEIRSFFAYDSSFSGGVYVASIDLGAGDAVDPGAFDLTLDTGAGDDGVNLEFVTGAPRVDVIDVHMGSGADNFALNWWGALQDPVVAQKVTVLVDLGGADPDRSGVGDLVRATFMDGDPDRPLTIDAIWKSENIATPDSKSLRIEMTSTGGILDSSIQLAGGSGRDTMQLFFQGKLKVATVAPQLRSLLDLGAGDDQVLLDFAALDMAESAKESPIALDVRGGAGDDELVVNGTDGADFFMVTESTVTLDGIADIGYAEFEFLRVNALAGDDTVTMTGINPRTRTTLDGGAGRDRFVGRFDTDVVGNLALVNFEQTIIQGSGRFKGTLTSDVPGLLEP